EFGTGINDDMPILFEGITMGRIHRYTIELNRRQIIAEAEFDPRYDEYLNDKSQFFLVKPRVSLSGIENLETLTKGQYVSLRPSTHGIPVAKFTVRNGAPPIPEDGPGLHLVLSANSAASLSPGTPILYHQLDVGSVQTIKLNPGEFPRFNVKIHIRPEYAHLVNRESRFWNARGVAIKGGVQSFEIRTESIASILQGGIAFTTPGPLPPTETAALRAQNGDRFTLYEDEEDSQINTRIQVHFDSGEGLREGMPVKYQDQKIGEVDSLSFATGSRAGLSNISANIRLFDWARSLIRNDTSIWLVKAKVGLTDIKNVDALVLGTYLEILPGTGRVTQRLTARQHPAKSRSRPRGLNLVLRGDHLGSVKEGHPISYRQIKVGDVISKDLSADANHVLVYINIYEEYVNLVKSDSVFWNASGIKVDAGLFSGVKINTESLETLITGGIAFATPPKHPQQENVGQGHEFTIHDKSRDTWLRWKPGIPLRN
ncbi:MAG: MlaD family protein, partial [Pseudomonadales bacterium]|nr:MlaD family protein [Pseudomonadales bacterium]